MGGDQHHQYDPDSPDDTPERFPDLKFVEPAELAQWLRNGDRKATVVDVREGDEFDVKHVVGAKHFPSGQLQADPSQAVAQLREEETIVVHCGYSRNRGPKAAQKLAAALKEAGIEGPPSIYVLKGGYAGFEREYGSSNLVE